MLVVVRRRETRWIFLSSDPKSARRSDDDRGQVHRLDAGVRWDISDRVSSPTQGKHDGSEQLFRSSFIITKKVCPYLLSLWVVLADDRVGLDRRGKILERLSTFPSKAEWTEELKYVLHRMSFLGVVDHGVAEDYGYLRNPIWWAGMITSA